MQVRPHPEPVPVIALYLLVCIWRHMELLTQPAWKLRWMPDGNCRKHIEWRVATASPQNTLKHYRCKAVLLWLQSTEQPSAQADEKGGEDQGWRVRLRNAAAGSASTLSSRAAQAQTWILSRLPKRDQSKEETADASKLEREGEGCLHADHTYWVFKWSQPEL